MAFRCVFGFYLKYRLMLKTVAIILNALIFRGSPSSETTALNDVAIAGIPGK